MHHGERREGALTSRSGSNDPDAPRATQFREGVALTTTTGNAKITTLFTEDVIIYQLQRTVMDHGECVMCCLMCKAKPSYRMRSP